MTQWNLYDMSNYNNNNEDEDDVDGVQSNKLASKPGDWSYIDVAQNELYTRFIP